MRSPWPAHLGGTRRQRRVEPYHFLRTFKHVTGVTHQWLLQAACARRQTLAAGRDPVTDIALDVGFGDLSNFMRSFRAEFGMRRAAIELAA
jgi:AraC-like DNA-binding protein